MVDFRINYGQTGNFYKRLAVSNTGFGDPNDGYRPDIMIPFSTYTVTFLNEGTGGTAIVEYSFDGFNVHGEINPTMPNKLSIFQNRVICKAWFRVKASSSGPITVAVEAWSIR